MTPAAQTVRQTALEALRDAIGQVFLQAEELLFALAKQSGEAHAVDLHLDTLRYLRRIRNDGAQAIARHLETRWARGEGDTHGEGQITQALKRLAIHAEAMHFEVLAAIERDLQAMGTTAGVTLEDLRPQAMALAIAAYLAERPAPPSVQLLLIRLLDQLLVPSLAEMYQRIRQVLEPHRPDSGGPSADGVVDHAATGVMERDALLAHLDTLQPHICAQISGALPELTKLRIIPHLPHETVLVPELQHWVDLVGLMVYDAMTDPTLSADLKPILLRLHLPLLKAVLLDQEVLHDAQHPVRQLWKRLLDLARLPNAEQAPWRPRVERVITKLCHDFGRDLGIFSAALEKLRTAEYLPRDIAPAMERPSPPRASALSFGAARSAATQTIHTLLAGHDTVPPPLRVFLLQTWGPLMLLIAQRTGPHGDDWEQAHGMMQKLVELAINSDGHLSEEAEDLLRRMQETLKRHGLEQRGFHKAFEALRQSLEKPSQETDRTASSPPSPLELGSEAPPSPPQPSLALPPRVVDDFIRKAFQPGDWFLVHVAEGQIPRRLKAYHVDTTLGVVVFADRLERPVLERPIDQFIDDVLAGRSHPVFEEERHSHAIRQLKQSIASMERH